MAEKFRFFDAVQDEFGQYDREYNAQEFTDYFKALVTTGIMKGAGNELKVTANGSNMITKIDTGIAFLLGRYYENDSFKDLTHDTETLGNSRIDRIVVRMDLSTNARYVKTFIKKGAPSANPTAPILTQTANLYEISLAQVRVVGGQTFIAVNNVTDERGKDVICPWAGSNILPNFNDETLEQLVNDVNTKLVDASTTRKGVVQLISSVSSTSTTLVPTAAALKSAYDFTLTKADKVLAPIVTGVPSSNGWTLSGCELSKDNFGMVNIQFVGVVGTRTAFIQVGTLPVGYRPARTAYLTVVGTDSLGTTPSYNRVLIYANGAMYMELPTPSGQYALSGSATFRGTL